ncbi:hypothetical protein BLOT_005967 [Blomia tropicalis]|nr:hypothetical protein BLOT_005967 [Blomia tropicalis]
MNSTKRKEKKRKEILKVIKYSSNEKSNNVVVYITLAGRSRIQSNVCWNMMLVTIKYGIPSFTDSQYKFQVNGFDRNKIWEKCIIYYPKIKRKNRITHSDKHVFEAPNLADDN